MVRSNGLGYDSNISDGNPMNHGGAGTGMGTSNHRHGSHSHLDTITSTTPLKSAASFTSSRATNAPLTYIQSRCEGGSGSAGDGFSRPRRERPDHFDLELGEIDGESVDPKRTRVRVDSAFEQREERV
jgi:hypothetical protein